MISLSRWVILIASLTMFLVYFHGGSLVIKDTKRSVQTTGDTINAIFVVVMFIAGFTVLATQVLMCLQGVKVAPVVENDWIAALGAIMVTSGIAAAFYIRHRYLKGLWSGNVEVREDHRIVKEGPYQTVRHPIYALTLLMYPGVALAFAVWWNLVACAVMTVGYIWLTIYEDRYLQANLPGYQAYQQQTRYRWVPGIW